MALPTFPTAAIAFLAGVNGNIYNAITNALGLAKGGHRQNYAPALNYLADAATYVSEAATEISSIAEQVAADALSAAEGSGTEASVEDIRGGADAEYLSTRRVAAAKEPVSIAFATPIAWDMASGIVFSCTLTAETTLPNPTGIVAGKEGVIDFVQGGAGGFEITSYGSYFKWFGEPAVFPAPAGSITKIAYYAKSATEIHLKFSGNYIA